MTEEGATEVPDDEPPKKVSKTNLPGDVSERRVRAEVQALLIGANMAGTTLGQLRAELEVRLGFDSGLLSSRSSLQRWVGGIIQHEAVKRNGRTEYCERVAKALVDFEGYPREARQMLIESLPHALPEAGGTPHPHQAQLLSIARDALGSARGEARRLQTEFLERTRPEALALDSLTAVREAAAGREAAALEAAEAASQALRDAEKEVWSTKVQLESAEGAIRSAHEEARRIEEARREATALRESAFQQLLVGELAQDERAAAIAKIADFVRQESAPASLLAGMPVALVRAPDDRSRFERTIVTALEELFDEHESSARERLSVEPEQLLGPAAAEARAAAEAAQAGSSERTASRDAAQAALEAASAERRAAEQAEDEQREVARPRLSEQERLAKNVQELDGLIEVLDGRLAAPAKGPAAQPSGGDDAGFTSPRKVATPMSERVRCTPMEALECA